MPRCIYNHCISLLTVLAIFYITKHHRVGGLKTEIYVLEILEGGKSKIKVSANFVLGENSSWLVIRCLLPVFSCVRKTASSLGALLERMLIVQNQKSTVMTLIILIISLLQIKPPWGLGLQHVSLQGT